MPLAVAVIASVSLVGDDAPTGPVTGGARLATLRAAHVWAPTDIPSMNVREGPSGPGAFPPGDLVECRFIPRSFDGSTPKFECALDGVDEVKVKYGRANGEVYAEVAASRLLWALGFGADRMYPVHVRCRGCPTDENGVPTTSEQVEFDTAVIERRFAGEEVTAGPERGWSWPELELVDERAGGAPPAHRDALKLLVAMLQHTDNKPEQQRVVCFSSIRPTPEGAACAEPFLLVQDVGKMFGRADYLNRDPLASVNLRAWQAVPVWADAKRCIARLDVSVTGTLHNPRIGEAGRAFLASLLDQLTDAQLLDLFDVARFDRRVIAGQPSASIESWVTAFKDKRRQIDETRCPV
jgi:hypothetical protein